MKKWDLEKKWTVILCVAAVSACALMICWPAIVNAAAAEVTYTQKVKCWRDGGNTAALSTTVAPGTPYILKQITMHLSAGGSGDLTVTKDAGAGAAYDTLLHTETLTTDTDWVWSTTDYAPLEWIFSKDDEIDVVYANANTKTIGIEIIVEEY